MSTSEEGCGDEAGQLGNPQCTAGALSATEQAMLRLEQLRWKYPALKDDRIREQFGMSPTRYYQVLNALVDKPAALAFAPATVHRLRRLRDLRRGARRSDTDR